jgi:putative Mn2+ efflux pump MntP
MKILTIILGFGLILSSFQVAIRGWVSLGQASDSIFTFGIEKYLIGGVFFLYGAYMIYASLKKTDKKK